MKNQKSRWRRSTLPGLPIGTSQSPLLPGTLENRLKRYEDRRGDHRWWDRGLRHGLLPGEKGHPGGRPGKGGRGWAGGFWALRLRGTAAGRKAALPLAMGSVRIWATLAEELECDLEYKRTGNLKVVWEAGKPEELEKEAAWEHEQGLVEVRMVTAAECQEIVPGLTERTLAGKFCPTDGMANPMRVTPALARAASRLGALIRTHTLVTGLLKQGDRVCGVITDKGEIEAEVVINTAGPWAASLNGMAGCDTPIRPGLDTLMITERQPRRFTPFLGFGWWGYALQPQSGNIIIGLEPGSNEHFTHRVEQAEIAQKARDMTRNTALVERCGFLAHILGDHRIHAR